MNRRTSLALAAMLATSSAAAAQMNATLFGVVDAAVGRFKGAPGGVNAQDRPDRKDLQRALGAPCDGMVFTQVMPRLGDQSISASSPRGA